MMDVPQDPQRAWAGTDDDRDRDEAFYIVPPWPVGAGEREPEPSAQRAVDETVPPAPPGGETGSPSPTLDPAAAFAAGAPIPDVAGPDPDEQPSRSQAAELLQEEDDRWDRAEELPDDQVPVLRADETDDHDGWDDVEHASWLHEQPPPDAGPHDLEERMPHAPVGG